MIERSGSKTWWRGVLAALFLVVSVRLVFAGNLSPDRRGPDKTGDGDETLSKLIADLGSPVWRTRENATIALMRGGPESYEALRTAYEQAGQYEVRRRIKRVVAEIYVTRLLGPVPAFLGIAHGRYNLTYDVEPRVPAGSTALLIRTVFPWTSADRAGLRRGDLLITLNGKRATEASPAGRFPTWIKQQKVGTPCRLGVLRGGKGLLLNKRAMRGFDPRGFSRLKTRVLHHDDDPRIAKGEAGFLIEDARRADPRLHLKKDDLLIALDGRPIPAEGAADLFGRWTQGERIHASAGKRGRAGKGAPQPVRRKRVAGKKMVPSAQILRGVRWVELDARLGRRPTYLPGGRAWQRGEDDRTMDDADAAFETWWAEEFEGARSGPGLEIGAER